MCVTTWSTTLSLCFFSFLRGRTIYKSIMKTVCLARKFQEKLQHNSKIYSNISHWLIIVTFYGWLSCDASLEIPFVGGALFTMLFSAQQFSYSLQNVHGNAAAAGALWIRDVAGERGGCSRGGGHKEFWWWIWYPFCATSNTLSYVIGGSGGRGKVKCLFGD